MSDCLSGVVSVAHGSGVLTLYCDAIVLTVRGTKRAVTECFANLECKATDYNLFILEVIKGWEDPSQKHPKTIHHHRYGKLVDNGRTSN
jgi:hypothetical protein